MSLFVADVVASKNDAAFVRVEFFSQLAVFDMTQRHDLIKVYGPFFSAEALLATMLYSSTESSSQAFLSSSFVHSFSTACFAAGMRLVSGMETGV